MQTTEAGSQSVGEEVVVVSAAGSADSLAKASSRRTAQATCSSNSDYYDRDAAQTRALAAPSTQQPNPVLQAKDDALRKLR